MTDVFCDMCCDPSGPVSAVFSILCLLLNQKYTAAAERRTANGIDKPSPTLRLVFSPSPETVPPVPTPIVPPEPGERPVVEDVVASLVVVANVPVVEVDGVCVNLSVPVPTGG